VATTSRSPTTASTTSAAPPRRPASTWRWTTPPSIRRSRPSSTANTIEYCSGPCVNAYRNTHSITLTNNTLRYSTYGFLTTDSDTGTISGNAIEHNKYQGVKLTTGSTGWAINTNDFFNNNTSVRGVIETGSFTTRTGTSSATADHLSVSSDSSATVGSNDYGP
jgi:parallel beta-helix repeat protein